MKYKIVKGSALFEQLTILFQRIEVCRKATHDLVDEFGVTEWVGTDRGSLAGGITGFKMESMPEGWKRVYSQQYHNAYFPKSIPKNKALLNRIYALPTLDKVALNSIVGYKPQWVGFTHHRAVGIKFGYDLHLVQVAEGCKYTPPKGMEEITVSEFNRLCEVIDEAEKEVIE